jgi:choline-sulfatase
MSDEHDPRYMGASGDTIIKTPHIDRLAKRGTRFCNAYTPCPICVPARASFATGLPVNQTRYWDNAMGYDGKIRGWGHRLQENGCRVDAIGKLHYRRQEDPLGFDHQINTMHLKDGVGAVWGAVRDPLPKLPEPMKMFKSIAPGVSNYIIFDRNTANSACEWFRERSHEANDGKPWMLYVGFASPHFPYVLPRKYFDLYPDECVPPRKLHPDNGYVRHPWLDASEEYWGQENLFTDESEKRLAIRAYYGLCSFLDDQIGMVLDALTYYGLADTTRIIYSSDHGDNVGARGQWGKSNLYEECTKIPMIIAGPDVPEGKVCKTPVTLLDCYQTIVQGVGLPMEEDEQDLPGKSLFETAISPEDPERVVMSEYHAIGAVSGAFMLRKGRFKFHYYVGFEPELFDIEADPEETIDLAKDPKYGSVLEDLENELRRLVDPEIADKQAKADQARLVEKHGGRIKALNVGALGATPVPGLNQE